MDGNEGLEIVLTPLQLAAILENDSVEESSSLSNRFWGAATLVGGAYESAVKSMNEVIRLPSDRTLRLTGVDGRRIADLWRRLRPTVRARCHTPPYGLRFWLSGQKVVEASLCWECANAYGYAGEAPIDFTLDPKESAAVSLLMQLRQVLPERST